MTVKQCSKCRQVKPLEEFSPDRKMASGRKSNCRACSMAHQKTVRSTEEYKAKRREHRKQPHVRSKESAYMAQWPGVQEKKTVDQKACSACEKIKPVDGFSKNSKTSDGLASWCKRCVADKTKQSRERPEVKERNAAYAKTPKVKEQRRLYRQTPAHKASQLKYRQSDKGQVAIAAKKARRRAREEGIICTLTGWDWRAIKKQQGNCCFYCKREFGDDLKPTQDHKIAIANGGHHTKENVVAACMHCNCSKKERDWPVTLPNGTPFILTTME